MFKLINDLAYKEWRFLLQINPETENVRGSKTFLGRALHFLRNKLVRLTKKIIHQLKSMSEAYTMECNIHKP